MYAPQPPATTKVRGYNTAPSAPPLSGLKRYRSTCAGCRLPIDFFADAALGPMYQITCDTCGALTMMELKAAPPKGGGGTAHPPPGYMGSDSRMPQSNHAPPSYDHVTQYQQPGPPPLPHHQYHYPQQQHDAYQYYATAPSSAYANNPLMAQYAYSAAASSSASTAPSASDATWNGIACSGKFYLTGNETITGQAARLSPSMTVTVLPNGSVTGEAVDATLVTPTIIVVSGKVDVLGKSSTPMTIVYDKKTFSGKWTPSGAGYGDFKGSFFVGASERKAKAHEKGEFYFKVTKSL